MSQEPLDWRRIAIAAYGPTLLVSIGAGAVLPLVALTARDLGASIGVAAFIVGLQGLGQLIGDLPAGALATRIGEKKAIIGAGVLEAAALIVAWQATSVVMLGLAIFVTGLAMAVFSLARQAYLTEVVPAHQRARALSTLGGMYRVGMFIGPLIGALVIGWFNISAAYAVAAGLSLAAAAVTLALPDVESDSARSRRTGPTPGILQLARTHAKSLATLGVGAMIITLGRAARVSLIPLWAESVGVGPQATSIIFAIAAFFDMAMFYPSGAIMDRYGRFWSAAPTLVALAVGFALLPLSHGALTVGLVATLLGLANGFSAGVVMTLGSDSSPDVGRAKYLGVWRLLTDTGNMGGPMLITLVVAFASLPVAALAISGICLFGAGWFVKWVPRKPGPPRQIPRETPTPDPTGPGSPDPSRP